jgi:dihydrofolate reductase
MRNVVVTEFMSLDGVIEDPGGAEGFAHGGWTIPYWDDAIGAFKSEELFAADALLLGRVTYQGFAAAWPTMEGTGEFGERMNALPKYVVSTTLQSADWNNSTIISENVAEAVAALKEQPGQDILVTGSGELIHTLRQHGLVDAYRLVVYPVVLGSGKRLFRNRSETAALELAEMKTTDTGAMLVTYRVAGTVNL